MGYQGIRSVSGILLCRNRKSGVPAVFSRFILSPEANGNGASMLIRVKKIILSYPNGNIPSDMFTVHRRRVRQFLCVFLRLEIVP